MIYNRQVGKPRAFSSFVGKFLSSSLLHNFGLCCVRVDLLTATESRHKLSKQSGQKYYFDLPHTLAILSSINRAIVACPICHIQDIEFSFCLGDI